jgi:hypothetical protein
MDCVIPLGSGSKWSNNELRYSLRGLDMYGDINNVWLIGHPPEWFTGNHIQFKEGPVATLNIWNKVREACLDPAISDPFMFANDDYFYQRPFSLDNFYGQVMGNSQYKDLLRHTMRILAQNGLDQLNFDVHRPMIIHKELFMAAYSFFEWHLKIGLGLVMKSCYGNLHALTATEITDIKFKYWGGEYDTDMFSIDDGCIDVRFKAWCEKKYPEKSKWEI